MIDFLDPKIKQLEQQIPAQAKSHVRASLNILLSVPGIGDPYLKWAIADIIIHASHKSKLIGNYYQKLQSRVGKRKAKSVISHKFGIAIYYMLKNKQVFDEKRFVQTNMK